MRTGIQEYKLDTNAARGKVYPYSLLILVSLSVFSHYATYTHFPTKMKTAEAIAAGRVMSAGNCGFACSLSPASACFEDIGQLDPQLLARTWI